MRIGYGFDAHRFGEPLQGHAIRLGGVDIPFGRVIIAHSDGDVILHAVCDALLGACALGDIGAHFPDTDLAYAGADSRTLVRACAGKVAAAGYSLANVDITLMAEQPKVRNFVAGMREAIAADLGVSPGQVSVKATTTERLGFIGREEGLAAAAVVLLT